MTTVAPVLALLLGYIIGSLPTASLLARRRGLDLVGQGSGNPGANNAWRLGGPALGIAVLSVEILKGLSATTLGLALGADWGGVAAGLGAVTGNVWNVWMGLKGGKGLGISAGVLVGLWPTAVLPALVVVGIVTALTRSSGLATLIALPVLVVIALSWTELGWSNGWGAQDETPLIVYAVCLMLVLSGKHWRDARSPDRAVGDV